MPLSHERVFRVRQYECSFYGYAKDEAHLRYMQEAAFDASAAAGYDSDRYDAMRRRWLVRETNIQYFDWLGFGDRVQVETWVTNFRTVRSRRDYVLRKLGSGQLAARAYTDWVFMDTAIDWPAIIPADLMAAFRPEGPAGETPADLPQTRFPPAPAPPPGVFRLRRRVEWQDLDPAQHVNNVVYLSYVEDAARQAAATLGWPLRRMDEAGFALATRQHRIEYRQPALPDDELEIVTWFSDVAATSAVRHATVTRAKDETLLTRAYTCWGCVDTKSGQPIPTPEAFLSDLQPQIVETPPTPA